MKLIMLFGILIIASFILLLSCSRSSSMKQPAGIEKSIEFDAYWYNNQAEITSYSLKQARYGEIHNGDATMIFVTEPFNTKKLVKSDSGNGKDDVPVLKLNQTRKFNTGIYPYSTMTSSFTPVNTASPGSTLKITTSVQEWCGHVFTQLSKSGNGYENRTFSYFESEGDMVETLENGILEDELFALIRINPKSLPTGKIKVLPSSIYLRFMHKPGNYYDAIASLEDSKSDNLPKSKTYQITYLDLKRTLKIIFDEKFPHKILGWTDEYPDFNGKIMKTSAIKENQLSIDYWNKHDVKDSIYFHQLFDFKN